MDIFGFYFQVTVENVRDYLLFDISTSNTIINGCVEVGCFIYTLYYIILYKAEKFVCMFERANFRNYWSVFNRSFCYKTLCYDQKQLSRRDDLRC